MNNRQITRLRLANKIEVAAVRCKAVNSFIKPIFIPSLVLYAVLTAIPSIYSVPGSPGRWTFFATGFLSMFSATATLVVGRETNILEDALEALKDGELKQAEALLKRCLTTPKEKK